MQNAQPIASNARCLTHADLCHRYKTRRAEKKRAKAQAFLASLDDPQHSNKENTPAPQTQRPSTAGSPSVTRAPTTSSLLRPSTSPQPREEQTKHRGDALKSLDANQSHPPVPPIPANYSSHSKRQQSLTPPPAPAARDRSTSPAGFAAHRQSQARPMSIVTNKSNSNNVRWKVAGARTAPAAEDSLPMDTPSDSKSTGTLSSTSQPKTPKTPPGFGRRRSSARARPTSTSFRRLTWHANMGNRQSSARPVSFMHPVERKAPPQPKVAWQPKQASKEQRKRWRDSDFVGAFTGGGEESYLGRMGAA